MVGMRDVAKKAGVSLSSVSLVINGTGYVSQDMRDKVEQAMRELNYVPNELARNFYHGKTGIVGVIVPTIQHPFFATLTAHLQREFAARSLRTMLCSTVDSANGEAQYVEMLRQRSLDALVVAAHTTHDVDYWTSIERPVVAFDRNLGAHIAQVSSDHARGGALVADVLTRTGARDVVIVGGPRAQFTDLDDAHTTFPTVRYVQTLEERLDAAGIAHAYIESGEVFDLDGIRRTVHDAFDAHPDIDAFVGADLAAAFAVQEAALRGIAVPGRLQIVAYDGTVVADCAGLPLTAVRQDFDAIARAIADNVGQEIDWFDDGGAHGGVPSHHVSSTNASAANETPTAHGGAPSPRATTIPVTLEECSTTR